MSAKSVTVSEIGDLLSKGRQLALFDVRTFAEYQGMHARGATSMPLDELEPAAIAATRSNPQEPIYVICQSGVRAGKACERFAEVGVNNVFSIEGGTTAWERAGLPVERSDRPIMSLERQVRITAGGLVMVGVVLGWFVHRAFYGIPLFVGSGLVFAGLSNTCGMGMLLAKMPWNSRH